MGMNVMTRFDTLISTAGRVPARFYADESGATAIEYAIIASGVGVAVATMVYSLGSRVNALFTTLAGLFP
jgi:pilus assembly protein Flp/PilA